MDKTFLTLDLETYCTKSFKRFGNALDKNNYIVAVAYKYMHEDAQVDYCREGITADAAFKNIDLSRVHTIIAQNARFDLLYLWSSETLQEWLRQGGKIFDTLQVEYLIRGQQVSGFKRGKKTGRMDLDSLVLKYGGTFKDKEVKNVFADGGTVLDIPAQQLIDYAKEDVVNTELVAFKQMKVIHARGMTAISDVYNDHLLATVEMEYNGMYINKDVANKHRETVEQKIEQINADIDACIKDAEIWPHNLTEFNVGSALQLSTLLFGGNLDVKQRVEMLDDEGNAVVFKSGKNKGAVRTRIQMSTVMIPGLNEKFKEEWRTDKGGRGVGVDVLQELLQVTENEITKRFVSLLLERRKLDKILATYLYKRRGKTESGLLPLIHDDGCVHSEYQTVETETGRLSSRNPNLQNVPPFVIDMFDSRFKNGVICELDFSQLEIVVQAFVTQCDNMLEDIEKGIDFHCLRLSYAENADYDDVVKLCDADSNWKLKRKNAKVISFQKSYGAHTSKIAVSTGLDEAVIKRVFELEDERYPEINGFYKSIVEELDKTSIRSGGPLEVRVNGKYVYHKSLKQYVGKWQSITGKIYTFQKKAVETKQGRLFEYWNMPNIMNYPIQGTAADIVAMQMARVFRFMIKHRDKGLMVNEIHDSCILDLKEEHAEKIAAHVQKIMKDVAGSFKTRFGITFNAPIEVDYVIGKNWKEAK